VNWELLEHMAARLGYKKILTIHLPPPPEDIYIWFGCVAVAYYAN